MQQFDPTDRTLGDMSQQGAGMVVTDPVVSAPASVNMGAVPQVSPLFDQFGNPYRTRADRNAAEAAQQVLSGGIASVAPTMAREANTNVVDATRSLQGPPAFIDRDVQRVPGGFQMKGTFDYPGTDRDTKLESTLVGVGAGLGLGLGLGLLRPGGVTQSLFENFEFTPAYQAPELLDPLPQVETPNFLQGLFRDVA